MIISPTLKALKKSEEDHELSNDIVCRTCSNAIWREGRIRRIQQENSDILQCYCPIFFTVTWATQEPIEFTQCDAYKDSSNLDVPPNTLN
jgi:hypothetical protein